MTNPISVDRTFGYYPVSMGTSLALEGLLHTGEFADANKPCVLKKYNELWLNIRTLFRNAFESFDEPTLREKLTPETLITCIEEDLNGIMEAARAASPSVICVPYLCQYKGLNKTFPEGNFRNATTPNQIFYNSLEQDIYKRVFNDGLFNVKLFDVKLENTVETLLFTHIPADLLWRKDFPSLALLESHTGKVKLHTEWYTKLNGKPAFVPFNKVFLLLYGDKVMFSPLDLKVRRVIAKVAEKYNWNQSTTMDRIHQCVKLYNEPFVLEFLNRLKR